MRAKNIAVGRRGEAAAREYLQNKGYRIIANNYRNRYSEIDLIARRKKTLVFVEVRAKTGNDFGIPEESLRRKKIQKLLRSAAAYVALQNYRGLYRIDAICIVFARANILKRLKHYKDITA